MALEINGRGSRAGLGPSARPVGHEAARTRPERPAETRSEGLAAFRPDGGAALPDTTAPLSHRFALRAGDVPDGRQEAPTGASEGSDRTEWNEAFFASFFDWREMLRGEDEA